MSFKEVLEQAKKLKEQNKNSALEAQREKVKKDILYFGQKGESYFTYVDSEYRLDPIIEQELVGNGFEVIHIESKYTFFDDHGEYPSTRWTTQIQLPS